MPVRVDRICMCAHEESRHDAKGCSHGRGTAFGGCACTKFRSRRGGRRSGAAATPTPSVGDRGDVGKLAQLLEQLGAAAIAAARELRNLAGGKRAPTPLIVPVPPPPGVTYAPDPRPASNPILRIKAPAEASGDLSAGERRVLAAIAQYPAGITREHLTVLTGYKKSTRDLYVQRLSRLELVAPREGRIFATPAGMNALGVFEPLPTGDALREYWLEKLPEGEAVVLEAVVRAWPHAAARAALEQATGYKKSTRDLYLQRLIRRELVEDAGPGLVRATSLLFDAARASA